LFKEISSHVQRGDSSQLRQARQRDLLESALSDEAAAMPNRTDISTSVLIPRCHAEFESALAYAREHFEDPPAIRDSIWTNIKT
jgi:hypothetical protein